MYFNYIDFELDTADNIPGKLILTIGEWVENEDGDLEFDREVCVIVHRLTGNQHEDDLQLSLKRMDAVSICDALNASIKEN